MKIEHLCHVKFTWDQLREILANEIEMHSNEVVGGTPEHKRLCEMASMARGAYSDMAYDDEGVTLMIDGVAYSEELP